jgi:IPT/TIG domain
VTLLRTLLIVTAALAFGFASPAQATAANVVPNPGFEQGGCGTTPIICGWTSGDPMSRDTMDTHSGGASMVLWKDCGPTGCFTGVFSASTDPAFCAGIGPGGHLASFWSRGWEFVSLAAVFFQDPDCTAPLGSDSFGDWLTEPGWQELTGMLVAPPGTQSALFDVSAVQECDDFCNPQAKFDDLYVEDAAVAGPAIGSFNPLAGPVGASVDIFGVNFTGATSVKFNGTAASFTVDSDSEIHATVPNGATRGPITVTTPTGTGTSNHLFGVQPTITSFTPTCGPAGSLVDILGSGFTGATTVRFSGTETSFTVDSDSEIHAAVPSAQPGAISVTTPGGTGMSSSPFMGSCPSMDPTISSFTPMSGARGTSVDILGTHFTGASWVYFNASVADFTIDSDSEIHAIVPSTATTGSIWVTTPHGTGISSSWFTVIGDTAPPATTITSGPSGTTSSTSATFEFTADEPATFECRLDGAGFGACTSPKTYTDLVDGSHTFRVRATDAAGNADPVPAERTWTVATSPPPPPPASCTGGAITIRDNQSASPYPSTCVVSGLAGTISDVDLRLTGLSHTYPDDVDVLLVSPAGQNAIVLSDAGGALDVVNCSLTLDDEAASALPDSGQIACPGAYRPANHGAGDPFPAPSPAPSGQVNLSSFDGGAPNGTWSLYVVDDAAAHTGHIDS